MKMKRMIASILLVSMIFSGTVTFAQDTTNDGSTMGHNDGYIYVLQNYTYGGQVPLVPTLPSSIDIITKYAIHLSGKTQAYRDRFISDYFDGYMEGFKQGRDILVTPAGQQPPVELRVNYAESLGSSMGEMHGYRDFYNNLNSSWSRAIPTNTKINTIFNLDRETLMYRSTFYSEFRTAYQEAYQEAFEYALLDNKDTIIGSAVEDGKELGIILGSIYGDKDYFEGKTNDFKRNLPSDTSIINDYNLNRSLDEYKIGFVNGFKLGYEEGYNEAYYNSFKEADFAGGQAGASKGQLMATKDYVENKEMSWSRHKSLDSVISNEYRLIYLSNVYRGSFINGYWTGFAEKYEETYKILINQQVNEKIALGIIPISGGILTSGDNSIAIEIQSGTFYNDTTLSIEKVFNDSYRLDEARYIKASDVYNIQLSNQSKNLDNSKAITIAMEYYGKYNGGIYKWVDNKWTYLPSIVKDGMIYIEINPNTLRQGDNLYRILIDKNYTVLTDVRSHWAKDEIDSLVRRNVITGYPDKTYKANRNISRGEFLALLSRVYNWNLPRNTDNMKTFKDYESFGYMSQLISYGINAKYIIGYGDNTFRPNNPISYKEVEIIMGRVSNNPNFKWHDTSARMLYEKQTRSNSYNNMNNKITRAEVAYMLYILNEWRY